MKQYRIVLALLLGISILLGACSKETEKNFPSISPSLATFTDNNMAPLLTTVSGLQSQFPLDGVTIEATAVVFDQNATPIEEIEVEVRLTTGFNQDNLIGSLHVTSERTHGYNGVYVYSAESTDTRELLIFSAETYVDAKAGLDPNFGVYKVHANAERLHRLADGDLRNWDYFGDHVGAYVGALVITAPLPDQTHNPDEDNVRAIMEKIGETDGGCQWQTDRREICPCEGDQVADDCRPNQPTGPNVTVNGIPVYDIGYTGNWINCCRTCGSMAASFSRVEVATPTYATVYGIGSIFGTKTPQMIDPAIHLATVIIRQDTPDGTVTLYEKEHWTNIAGNVVIIEIPPYTGG